jgi:hypothetical protein
MAILTPTDIVARVLWTGVVRDRAATLASEPVEALRLGFDGAEGDRHAGATRPSCSRVKAQYPRGTEIRNARQLSLVSAEEMAAVAAEMGIPELRPEWTGANLLVEGAPRFTEIPPGSRLVFETGASIAVDMENAPCRLVGDLLEGLFPGRGAAFPPAARGRRGVTGWVERPGVVRAGDVARLHVPPQRIYAPALRPDAADVGISRTRTPRAARSPRGRGG